MSSVSFAPKHKSKEGIADMVNADALTTTPETTAGTALGDRIAL